MNKNVDKIILIVKSTVAYNATIDHEADRIELNGNDFDHIAEQIAEQIGALGYRKSTDVAREIFAEIEKRFEALLKFYPCNGEFEDAKKFVDFHWKHIRHSIMCDYDVDLKKKYESEGADDGNGR